MSTPKLCVLAWFICFFLLVLACKKAADDELTKVAKDTKSLNSSVTYYATETDTLWSVAKKHYGNPTYWPIIFKYSDIYGNPAYGKLNNPDYLCEGMKLTLPELSDLDISNELASEYVDLYSLYMDGTLGVNKRRALGFLVVSYKWSPSGFWGHDVLSPKDFEVAKKHLSNIILGKELNP